MQTFRGARDVVRAERIAQGVTVEQLDAEAPGWARVERLKRPMGRNFDVIGAAAEALGCTFLLLTSAEAPARPREARRPPKVPPWVPADLVAEYMQIARESDEFAAAAHVRRLKREAKE